MSRISLFIATCLDGFIVRKDGGFEWLHKSGDGEVDNGKEFDYDGFIHTVDELTLTIHSGPNRHWNPVFRTVFKRHQNKLP